VLMDGNGFFWCVMGEVEVGKLGILSENIHSLTGTERDSTHGSG
jgi:hypothetical protein